MGKQIDKEKWLKANKGEYNFDDENKNFSYLRNHFSINKWNSKE